MHTVEIDHPLEGVGRITLNRPHVLNAINHELLDDFVDATSTLTSPRRPEDVHHPQRCRPRLSAGFDLKAEAAEGALPVEEWADRFQSDWDIFLRIWKSAKPYVAAVQGYDLVARFELSLLADVTLAARSAQFGLPEIRHGGGPGATMLPWVVGMKAAKWLMLTGIGIGTERTLELGLVTEVVDDDLFKSRFGGGRRARRHPSYRSQVHQAGAQPHL